MPVVDCKLVISGRDTTIREQHRLRKQRAEQSGTQPIVVRFAWREREMDRQNDIEAAAY